MSLFRQIEDAIWQLEALGKKHEDIRIAYSRLVELALLAELSKKAGWMFPPGSGSVKMYGIVCNNEFPYNKIVVYSPDCALRPDLLIEIEIEKK